MKIYFAGSIRGGRNDKELYLEIIKVLSKFGTVLTEHVGNKNLTHTGEMQNDAYIYQRDIKWIKEGDIFIAEVTTPSLGVGYEIREGELQNKPILCLYRKIDGQKISAMIAGSDSIALEAYGNISDVEVLVKKFISERYH